MDLDEALAELSLEEKDLIVLMRLKRNAVFEIHIQNFKPDYVMVYYPDYLTCSVGDFPLKQSDLGLISRIREHPFGTLIIQVLDGEFRGVLNGSYRSYKLSKSDAYLELEKLRSKGYNIPVLEKNPSGTTSGLLLGTSLSDEK